jgi:hypothetical protein
MSSSLVIEVLDACASTISDASSVMVGMLGTSSVVTIMIVFEYSLAPQYGRRRTLEKRFDLIIYNASFQLSRRDSDRVSFTHMLKI